MLRLQGMYPESGGVPPPVPKPVILLIVRKKQRGLGNNDKVGDEKIFNNVVFLRPV